MSEQYEWNEARLFYEAHYELEKAYNYFLAQQPPDVRMAYRVLERMYSRAAFAFSKKEQKELDGLMQEVRSLLYDSEYSRYAWVPAVAEKRKNAAQEALDKLAVVQRRLYECMNDKNMLIPKASKPRMGGYGAIASGGVVR